MSERADRLAADVVAVNDEVIAFLGSLSDEEWGAPMPHDRWPVNVGAHHIAVMYPEAIGLMRLVATGQPVPPMTQADIDASNARHAREHASATPAESVDLLRRNGAAAATAVRELTDAQLDRSALFFGSFPWSAQAVIDGLMTGHARAHLRTIQQGVEAHRAHSQRRRAQRLAERLEAENGRVIAFVEGLTDEQWHAQAAHERWSVGVAAHHIAAVYPDATDLMQRVASGWPLPPRTQWDIDIANAQHAQEHADVSRNATLELLRHNGVAAVAAVRELRDEELDRTALFFGLFLWTAEAVVEGLMIGHARNHLHSMQRGLGTA